MSHNGMRQFTVTVEFDVFAADEDDARSTNFWCSELNDDGMVVGVSEVPSTTEAPTGDNDPEAGGES